MKLRNLFASACLLAASTGSMAATQALFEIDGDTFSAPFRLQNVSTASEMIMRFQLFLAPAGLVFDTANGGVPNDTNGLPLTQLPQSSAVGLVLPAVVADGSPTMDVSFTDFNSTGLRPGGGTTTNETFVFGIDIDSGLRDTITGNELAGPGATLGNVSPNAAYAWIDFSNGERLIGSMILVDGRPLASRLFETGRCIIATTCNGTQPPVGVPEPGSLALAGLALLGLGLARSRRV